MIERGQLHIDGTWRSPHGDGTIDVIDAHDETVMGRVPSGDAQDAIAAIEAAHRALPGWHGLAEYSELLAMNLPADADPAEVVAAVRAMS